MSDSPELYFIREQLARIEGKLDAQAASAAQTRESLAKVSVKVDSVVATVERHSVRIGLLEGFRFKILGAIAAAGASGGGIAALVVKLFGG